MYNYVLLLISNESFIWENIYVVHPLTGMEVFFFSGMVRAIRVLQKYFTWEEILHIHNKNHAHKQQDKSETCLEAHFVISSQLYIAMYIHILLGQMKTNAGIP